MTSEEVRHRQYCALVAGLDVLGDMWTVLVVRELLVAPATEQGLLEGIPGLTPELLASRLESLCDNGIVEGRGEYQLTELGARLDGPLLALAQWGRELTSDSRGR